MATTTYAVLEISEAAFAEIKAKLEAASYYHCFDRDLIKMEGIALKVKSNPVRRPVKTREQEGK